MTQLTEDEIRTVVRAEMGAMGSPVVQCTTSNPHDTMTYQRGPNMYHCRCGKTYRKDGAGGLEEVV